MSFRTAVERTLFTLITTRDLMSVAILSIVLYAFYYPAPYAHQAAQAIPLVIVDQDGSQLSRRLVRHLGETREVRIVAEMPDMASARQTLRRREAEGILLLPSGFSRDVLVGRPGSGFALWINGSYLLRAEAIGTSLVEVTVDALKEQTGERAPQIVRASMPRVLLHPLFNTTDGYRDYIFPSVANIILQQTLLLASARLFAERRRRGEMVSGVTEALGIWAGCALIGVIAAFFYFGLIYWIQDIPRGGNMFGLLLAVPTFASAVAGLGLLIGSFFRNGDDALKVIIPTSVPLVFLAGFAWPLANMPEWLSTLVWASPATPAMHLFVRINQMGARVVEATGPLLVMVLLAAAYGTSFVWRAVMLRRCASHGIS